LEIHPVKGWATQNRKA